MALPEILYRCFGQLPQARFIRRSLCKISSHIDSDGTYTRIFYAGRPNWRAQVGRRMYDCMLRSYQLSKRTRQCLWSTDGSNRRQSDCRANASHYKRIFCWMCHFNLPFEIVELSNASFPCKETKHLCESPCGLIGSAPSLAQVENFASYGHRPLRPHR
jgi:hypothetical protein